MPKARAPKAPWVLVWLSPQTMVLPGLREAEFRSDDVHDAALIALEIEQLDAELGAVLLQLRDLLRGRFDRDRHAAEDLLGAGRTGVIDGGQRAIRPPHLEAALAQHRERLGRGDFVDQMQVDVQHRGRIGGLRHDLVLLPDLLKHGLHVSAELSDSLLPAPCRERPCMST